jgi:hypothetical protein
MGENAVFLSYTTYGWDGAPGCFVYLLISTASSSSDVDSSRGLFYGLKFLDLKLERTKALDSWNLVALF